VEPLFNDGFPVCIVRTSGVYAEGDDGTSELEIVNTVKSMLSNVTSDSYTETPVERWDSPDARHIDYAAV